MCGITGYYAFDRVSENLTTQIKSASEKLQHRGPDDAGYAENPKFAVAHRRLSILDPSEAGHQPMQDPSGRYLLAYNGECYNFKALQKDLQDLKVNFKSNSDTEVLLHLLIHFGKDGLKKINGFFSLAFYDLQEDTLLLARDRFGIKPLYYQEEKKGVAFASELDALVAFEPKRKLNHQAVNAYLHLNYIPAPHTIYEEVYKLKPGTVLEINKNKVCVSSFYQFYDPSESNLKWTEVELAQNLEKAVQKRLVSDVPISCFLSGGLDSSIITGLASKHHPRLNTYNLGFKNSGQYDESKHAALVAKHFGTSHHEIEIDPHALLDNIPNLLNGSGEPFADSSAIALFHLCKSVGKEVKVALSGDGGDELFAGYLKHRATHLSYKHPLLNQALSLVYPFIKNFPESRKKGLFNEIRKAKRWARTASLTAEERYWQWAGFGNGFAKNLRGHETFNAPAFLKAVYPKDLSTFERSLEADIAMVLEGDMLVKADRMGMSNGLEIRVPFLDHQFVEYVNGIPAAQKINAQNGKLILKRSFKNLLPKEIMNKPKQGFEVPLSTWLKTDLSGTMNELLKEDLIAEQNLFNPKGVQELKTQLYQTNDSNAAFSIWNLMVFNQWWLNHREILTS